MAGRSTLNDLNQELFRTALKLNEAYIIKHSEEIIKNLKLFLPQEEKSYICQKFYDSSDLYREDKQHAIRSLWNTVFLCFPVITTTLDSFTKRCFHLIPDYVDLELIDEAGQILPHNFVSAAYRGKRAVIVGDVNQIEPIVPNVNTDFIQSQKNIGKIIDDIKVDTNSVQSLANKNTDILNKENNVILSDHYRCENNIINFSNVHVYNNRLNLDKEDNMDKPFFNNMVALDVRGKKTYKLNENITEVEACIETIKYIKEENEEDVSIAVITPFNRQRNQIEDRLKTEGIKDVKVGTVHSFQGQQKDYIIFSPVIDSLNIKWAIKFIGDKCNMINVAVTRAKKQFIYLGNLDVALHTDNYIAKLIKYIKKNGIVYSLYNTESDILNERYNDKILKILQPELNVDKDEIGNYIEKNFKNGIIKDAKQSYEFLKFAMKRAKKDIYIISPWIRENVINEEFLQDLQKLKEKEGTIKILFGYKKGKDNVQNSKDIVQELLKTNSLGYSSPEEVQKIIEKIYEIIGKEGLIYNPPIHAKILIIDNKYMCIGSHNWLSNAGKTNEKQRAIEGTKITTNKESIDYVKEEYFKLETTKEV